MEEITVHLKGEEAMIITAIKIVVIVVLAGDVFKFFKDRFSSK